MSTEPLARQMRERQMMNTTAIPGWYPNPSGDGKRYWDGDNWSRDIGVPAPAERRLTIHYGFVVVAVFSLIGTLGPFAITLLAYHNAINEGSADVASDIATTGTLWLLWGGMWTVIWAAFAVHHTLRGRR